MTRRSAFFQIGLRVIDRRRPRRAASQNASFSSDDAQAMTRAPISLPISMAARPVPPAAPSTASVSPACNLRAVLQRMDGRAVDDRDAGRAIEVEIVRHLHELSALTAICSRARHSRDSRARGRRLKVRHAGADAFHHPGEFGGRRKREGRLDLVFAGDDQRVEEIKRRGRLATTTRRPGRLRVGNVSSVEIVRAAGVACRGLLSWMCRRS